MPVRLGVAALLRPPLLGSILGWLGLAAPLPACAREAFPEAAAASRAGEPAAAAGEKVRLRWLAELGAESLLASSRPPVAGGPPIVVSVPGAAYAFAVGPDGSLRKRRRLAADPAAPYGVAVTPRGVALADRQGTLSLWASSAESELSPKWRQDVGDRVTSVGWDGGDLVLAATWKGRLFALAAADGRSLWSTDLAGRAEAPAVADATDVFVATKAKALFRLDAASGAVRWKVALPALALHPPVLLGPKPRLVICGTWDGQLLAHDSLTGRVRWSVTLPARLAGAPVAASRTVAAVTADGAVHTYDPTGILGWTMPGSAEGPATLLSGAAVSAGGAPRLVSVSKVLAGLDLSTGARLADYPTGAAEDLRRRFADAMLDGVKTYSEAEKRALLEQEAFEISGPLFGPARLFGPHVAFGTEDGWAYLFDAVKLRPLARYRAGQPSSGLPRLGGGRVLAVAGEELFALEAPTGRTAWRRIVGADPGRVTGEATLGVVAGGRVHAVGVTDGVVQWSLRGRFRSVAPPEPAAEGASGARPWVVDDGEGNLRGLWPPGRLAGDPLPAGGDLLPVVASPDGSWVAATREGSVFGVAWEAAPGGGGAPAEGRLVKVWERAFGERIVEVHLADQRLLVRSEAGSLAGLDAVPRGESAAPLQELWRMPLSRADRVQVAPGAGAFLVFGAEDVRVHDWVSGELRVQRKVLSPAVGGDLEGHSLRWLDRWGGVHRVDVLSGAPVETTDLGVPLAGAVPVPGGFLVTTAADEVGFVDVADESAAARSRLN